MAVRAPNLRLSSAVLGQLANPSFAKDAGAAIGASMLAPERREEERIGRAAEEQTLDLLRQAQIAEEQGDTGMLTKVSSDLSELLPTVKNEEIRNTITDAMGVVNDRRSATQANETTNTANAIIKIEEQLEAYRTQEAPLTAQEQQVQQVLTDRLSTLNQNAKAATQASDIKYNTRVTALKRENELAAEQAKQATQLLGSVEFDSPEYQQIKTQLKQAGQGAAIDKYETSQYQLIEAKDAADDIRASREPLSAADKKLLKDNGFEETGDIKVDRGRLGDIREATDARKILIANRALEGAGDPKAHVIATLETLAAAGNQNILMGDLASAVNEILDTDNPEELETIVGLVTGPDGKELTPTEIQNNVIEYIRGKYPDEFKDMAADRERKGKDATALARGTNDVLAQARFPEGHEKAGQLKYKDATTVDDDGNITVDLSQVDEKDLIEAEKIAARELAKVGKLGEQDTPGAGQPAGRTGRRVAAGLPGLISDIIASVPMLNLPESQGLPPSKTSALFND